MDQAELLTQAILALAEEWRTANTNSNGTPVVSQGQRSAILPAGLLALLLVAQLVIILVGQSTIHGRVENVRKLLSNVVEEPSASSKSESRKDHGPEDV